jgi:hypothetical protein
MKLITFTATCLLCTLPALADEPSPSAIDYAMYFQSAIKDAEYCSMKLVSGQLQAVNKYNGNLISNPAMTCPDMFSWKLFAEVVTDKFWSHWADEQQNWPSKPYPLCQTGQKPSASVDCCLPGDKNNSTEHCPLFPGERFSKAITALAKARPEDAEAHARKPELKRHTRLPFHSQLNPLIKVTSQTMLKAGQSASTEPASCSAVTVNGQVKDMVPAIYQAFKPADAESIGRVIRQTNAELTVRNQAFHNYLFSNNLYNANGALEVFFASQANMQQDAPYRRSNQSAQTGKASKLVKIDLPPEAVMIKSNWLHQGLAAQLGMNADASAYASKHLATKISLNALGLSDDSAATCQLEGIHYLVAFHISSKDIPNWVWTTFEHIALPGRCDVTGCNDAYGYNSADSRPVNTAANYVVPNQQSDKLNQGSNVLKADAGYASETIRPEWQKLLSAMKIGTQTQTNAMEPAPENKAWLNYRLKGSQVEYVNAIGQPTFLGNSVTEAGFMAGSSCMGCHSRAGVAALDTKPGAKLDPGNSFKHFLALSVFETSLSDFGYFRSHHGMPNPAWYYRDNNSSPKLEVMQADFIWGFLNAQPLMTPVAPK